MRRLYITSGLLLITGYLYAQEFGGNPPTVRWKQISTDTARIIFPEGRDSTAQRVASIIHFLAAKNNSLGGRRDKINIVLQNQSTIANGYVGLGPYRCEFFLTPSFNNFDLGSIPWADNLALHEYRHVQQFSNFRVGLSKAMYYLFGEEGLAVAINAAIPDWFYEGDAVYNETVHSPQGRGRIPFFTNQSKSLWAANKNYSWMKLRNGSLKDYVPNHYPLGYLLVNYGYEKYGPDFWKKVTQDAAAYKGLFYPFQNAIKAHAGVDYKTFRKQAFDYYKTGKSEAQVLNGVPMDRDQEKPNQGTEAGEQKISTPTLDYVTNYFFPYAIGNDSLLYLKSSYRKRPAFIIKDRFGEHIVRIKDISLDEQYSYRNGKIVYSAFKPDMRWGWRNYGEICVLDLRTGQQQKITRNTKYFAPDISIDGKKIAAVYYDEKGGSELHILDAASGKVLQIIEARSIALFTDPKFIDRNSLVSCIRFTDGRMSLARVDLSTRAIEYLIDPTWHVIGFPNVSGNDVYFTASFSSNDELHSFNLSTRKVYKVTNSALGKYFGSSNNHRIIYSSFTADGYQLRSKDKLSGMVEVDLPAARPAGSFKVANENLFRDRLIADPGFSVRHFPVFNYRKETRLLNFHSWRPYYEDPIFTYTLYGQNILNTLQTELYYLYNQDERTNAVGLSATYGALFPFLSVGTEYTFKRTDTLNNITRAWNQLDTRIGVSLPLNFSGGRFFRSLNLGSNYVFRVENNTGPTKDLFVENNFSYLSHFITYSQQVQMARQHIYPRLGGSISLQFRDAISKYKSYQFFGSANVYLPGVLPTHSIVLNGSIQERDTVRALFSDRFADARGYSSYYYTNAGSRMWRLSANYHLPLLIPDWGFGNIVYIQRIRTNLFYDFQRIFSDNKKTTVDLRSTGLEFYFDTNWWNQYPLTFGFRISHLLDDDLLARTNGTYFELIVPVVIPR